MTSLLPLAIGHAPRVEERFRQLPSLASGAPSASAPEGASGESAYSATSRFSSPGRALDVSRLVLFLASDEACSISGETILVDGGFTLPAS